MTSQPSWCADAASPDDAAAIESLYCLGHLLMTQERHADAAVVFRLMVRVAPTDERAWLALGECHARAGQSEVALELWGAGSVAAAPALRCNLARFRALWDADRIPEADDAFEEAVATAEQLDDYDAIALTRAERSARP